MNHADSDGSTALLAACAEGHAEIATLLIDAKANVDHEDTDGTTALWTACSEGHLEVATLLISANANVDHEDSHGTSVLWTACSEGHTEVVTVLLAAKANTKANWDRFEETDGFESPLWIACHEGHLEVVTLLISANADVNEANIIRSTPLWAACDGGANANSNAAARVEIVSVLLAARADVNLCDVVDNSTPLWLASATGNAEVVTSLLAANADVNKCDRNDMTPLCVACSRGHSKVVTKLLDANASVEGAALNSVGTFSPLSVACAGAHTEIVAKLLAAGANPSGRSYMGMTPLKLAFSCARRSNCAQSSLDCVMLLSSYGVELTNDRGVRTAESEAALYGQTDHIIAWLVRSRLWSTALHHLEVLTTERALALLRAGANVHAAAEPGGPTPLSLAQALAAAGGAKEGTAAFLVLEAAKPWSFQTHKLFPEKARARAVALMLVGELLSRKERFAAYGPQAVADAWMTFVAAHDVDRSLG